MTDSILLAVKRSELIYNNTLNPLQEANKPLKDGLSYG